MTMIPFIDLTRHESGFFESYIDKVRALTRSATFIGGDEVISLERRLQSRLKVKYAVTCANGTDALQLALRAVGVTAGDTVLVPNLTFWATVEAVVNVAATPVLIDADLRDAGISFEAFLEALEKEKPRAAIIAHLYGWGTSRLSELRKRCEELRIPLIEDGAQCFGTTVDGNSIAEGALVSTTSFYPAKVLGAAGDGGAVFTSSDRIGEAVRNLANHGRSKHYEFAAIGWNSRLDSFQAAYLNLGLDYLDQRIESRRFAARYYRTALEQIGIHVMAPPDQYNENGYCNVCIIRDQAVKNSIEATLRSRKIGFANIYPGTMLDQPALRTMRPRHFGGNNAEQICSSVLNLPLFPYIRESELNEVLAAVFDGKKGK